ncbi:MULTISPECIES: BMP family lipoprotein [Streptomyces]|uniref:BMP family ABC transporter substrate-binding protein n=1 Tax=Streptomyces tendae TaxID=1932 RepID=A0A6B3QM82_STRTE|nr:MULTISPECIES: BMP family ABC transporter substrate-binding protein [Streptomyces]BET48075.1 BMP family ABC transporter substrate-binding protein [Kitasatospora aureofaciens]MBQ0965753.1 BMP family ABC transporter substrate-binding protein [Streptomyces sp. RK74B]MBQ1006435.1 BMP family ABC transporter substrate-binding protein [Streptomyces sp. RK23]MCW1096072.1 BMP family ABC transporter substrate-binding protein [Streptomyces sp. RS2]NEV88230.1 BMP family ABC transporter substrate-binding
MRRTSRLTRVAVGVASLALAATACGGTSGESGDDGGDDKGLAIAYDVGGKGDQSFNDAAYAGLERAKKEFGYQTADIEPTDGETDADKEQRLTSLAKQGYNPVIGVGFAYGPAMKAVAAKYPDTTFGIVDSVVEGKNVASLVFAENEASYLAGVVAAKATKSKTVGFVGGVDVPLIHKFQAGYEQGVKDTDPKIKVVSQYLTQTAEEGGFSSPDKGKAAAEGQIEKKADVVYAAAGLSGQGVIEAAAKAKIWAIGVDSDQYKQEALAAYKDSILTSALKDINGAVFALAKSVEDGKPLTGTHTFDLKSDGVGLSDSNPKFAEVPGAKEAVEKAKAGIVDGSIKVATE